MQNLPLDFAEDQHLLWLKNVGAHQRVANGKLMAQACKEAEICVDRRLETAWRGRLDTARRVRLASTDSLGQIADGRLRRLQGVQASRHYISVCNLSES